MSCKNLIHAAWLSGCIALSALTLSVSAAPIDNWPSQPITIVVPSSPGGAGDTLIRVLADKLTQKLGQTVIVENKAGASGIVGTQSAIRAPADGYTFLLGWATSIISPQFIVKDLPFDTKRDLVPISTLVVNEMVMVVNASVPVKNVQELVAWAKSRKGQLSYGSYGTGSLGHLQAAYLSKEFNLDATHVPYKGEAPMLMATASNEVSFGIVSGAAAKMMEATGKVRIIGVSIPERSKDIPDVATYYEVGFTEPLFSVAGWYGLFASKNTPPEVVAKMEHVIMDIMADPDTRQKLSSLSMPILGTNAVQLAKTWDAEIPVYRMLFKSANLEPN